MCGIAGIFSSTPHSASIIEGMITELKRRGPDALGKFVNTDSSVSLGHTRLSIIDLSERANQPFYSSSGRYIMVYNGEIYNFISLREELQKNHNKSFKTNSDTEVVLASFEVWGPTMIERLEGMYALAIYDREKHELFLARDRFGKKPLFYFHSESCFAFASEIKSLLKIPQNGKRQVNKASISSFLHLGYIPEPFTIFESIQKFPSASYAVVNRSMQVGFTSYWNKLQEDVIPKNVTAETAMPMLEEMLAHAVHKRLIADVPIGTFLSGGTDSSLVTAVASRHSNSRLKTFSVGFKDPKFDESAFARQVAKHLGTDHYEFLLEERQALEILPQYLNHFDEPFADTSSIPMMLVAEMASREVKVVLTGDGGDELFLGYGAYRWADRLATWPFRLNRGIFSWILDLSNQSRVKRVAHLLAREHIGTLQSHIFSQEHYFFAQHELRDQIFKNADDFSVFDGNRQITNTALTAGEKQAIFDLSFYLKDDLLVKVDRSSMYHGLECRCPLLDNDLVSFALSLPVSLKRRGSVDKWLLKEILAKYLPSSLVHRPKRGFSIPMASWLKTDLRYLIDENLSRNAIEQTELFRPDKIKNLIRNFDAGKDYLYQRLWVLIVIQRWLIQHDVGKL